MLFVQLYIQRPYGSCLKHRFIRCHLLSGLHAGEAKALFMLVYCDRQFAALFCYADNAPSPTRATHPCMGIVRYRIFC